MFSCPDLDHIYPIRVNGLVNSDPVAVYSHPHNDFMVVWATVQGPNTTDIWAGWMPKEGAPKEGIHVAGGAGQKRSQPAVAYNHERDEVLIAYAVEQNDGSHDLYGKRMVWNGSTISTEFLIHVGIGDQVRPDVTYNERNDEYLVVYESQFAGGLIEINAIRLRASDGMLLSWSNVATGAGEQRTGAKAAYNLERNDYLIAYDFVGIGSPHPPQIRAKRAVATLLGVSAASESHVCCDPSFTPQQWGVSVAMGPDEYLTTFLSGITASPVYARRVAHVGESIGPAEGFSLTTDSPLPWKGGDLDYSPAFGYLAVWYAASTTPPIDYNIYGCAVRPGKDWAAGKEYTISAGTGEQQNPSVACAPDGACLVVWEFIAPTSSTADIRGRIIRPCQKVLLPFARRN